MSGHAGGVQAQAEDLAKHAKNSAENAGDKIQEGVDAAKDKIHEMAKEL